jgi:UrcA family protein
MTMNGVMNQVRSATHQIGQVVRDRSLLGAAAVVCALFAGNVSAKDHNITVAFHVSAEGLDLSRPGDAQTFYSRLQHAAEVACNYGRERIDLVPLDNPKACYEKALGNAIGSAKAPALTLIYLATHTLHEAAAHGIEVPAQVAAK